MIASTACSVRLCRRHPLHGCANGEAFSFVGVFGVWPRQFVGTIGCMAFGVALLSRGRMIEAARFHA